MIEGEVPAHRSFQGDALEIAIQPALADAGAVLVEHHRDDVLLVLEDGEALVVDHVDLHHRLQLVLELELRPQIDGGRGGDQKVRIVRPAGSLDLGLAHRRGDQALAGQGSDIEVPVLARDRHEGELVAVGRQLHQVHRRQMAVEVQRRRRRQRRRCAKGGDDQRRGDHPVSHASPRLQGDHGSACNRR